MWLYCRKTIILVQAFGNGRSSHARCCSPVGEPANSTPYNALIMRAVFFVRVVRLVRPLEHALLARIPERCLGVPLAGFATLGGMASSQFPSPYLTKGDVTTKKSRRTKINNDEEYDEV